MNLVLSTRPVHIKDDGTPFFFDAMHVGVIVGDKIQWFRIDSSKHKVELETPKDPGHYRSPHAGDFEMLVGWIRRNFFTDQHR